MTRAYHVPFLSRPISTAERFEYYQAQFVTPAPQKSAATALLSDDKGFGARMAAAIGY